MKRYDPIRVWVKASIPFLLFMLIFMINLFIPLERFNNYGIRLSRCIYVLIAITALLCIIRYRTYRAKEAVLSIVLGLLCSATKLLKQDFDGLEIVLQVAEVAIVFYGSCLLFEQGDMENNSLSVGARKGISSFFFGVAVSIPLAVLNILYFSTQAPMHIGGYFAAFVSALRPGIQEEIFFRFFLLALGYKLLRGNTTNKLFSIYIYVLMIVPHSLIHLPDLFLSAPGSAVVMLVLTSVFFGFPMALLMKRKNVQAAIGMHWFIDFIRFAAGY